MPATLIAFRLLGLLKYHLNLTTHSNLTTLGVVSSTWIFGLLLFVNCILTIFIPLSPHLDGTGLLMTEQKDLDQSGEALEEISSNHGDKTPRKHKQSGKTCHCVIVMIYTFYLCQCQPSDQSIIY